MNEPNLCLRWESYDSCLLASVSSMFDNGVMTDITISAEGRSLQAHRVILSLCSDYIKEILKEIVSPMEHIIIVLPFAKFCDLEAIVEFMYRGKINVTHDKLPGLLKVAEVLQVKGLAKLDASQARDLIFQALHSKGREELSSTYCDAESTEDELNHEEEEIDNPIKMEGEEENKSAGLYADPDETEDHELVEAEENMNFLNAVISSQNENVNELFLDINPSFEGDRSNGGSSTRKTLQPVSCPVCGKVLSNAYNLKVHMSIHENITHKCSFCGHTSKSRDALRKHLAYRHLVGLSGPVRPRLPASRKKHRATATRRGNPNSVPEESAK